MIILDPILPSIKKLAPDAEDNAKKMYESCRKIFEEAEKKKHLATVVWLITKIESLIEDKIFEKYDVAYIEFNFHVDYMSPKYSYVTFYDKKKQKLDLYREVGYQISEITTCFTNHNHKFVNDIIKNGSEFFYQLEPGIKYKIADIFLNKELRIQFEHDELQVNLSSHDVGKENKLKI